SALEIRSVNPTAEVRGATTAHVDGTVTVQDLSVIADATPTATADALVVSISLTFAGAAADATARTDGDTEAYFGSSAQVAAPANATPTAGTTGKATSTSTGGAGGALAFGYPEATSEITDQTRAFVDNGARIQQTGNFALSATGTATGSADSVAGAGGG